MCVMEKSAFIQSFGFINVSFENWARNHETFGLQILKKTKLSNFKTFIAHKLIMILQKSQNQKDHPTRYFQPYLCLRSCTEKCLISIEWTAFDTFNYTKICKSCQNCLINASHYFFTKPKFVIVTKIHYY